MQRPFRDAQFSGAVSESDGDGGESRGRFEIVDAVREDHEIVGWSGWGEGGEVGDGTGVVECDAGT